MPDFSEFLASQSTEVESQGSFTVNATKAREKLRVFQEANDSYFLYPILQALVAAGASDLALTVKRDTLEIEAEVEELEPSAVFDAWGSVGMRDDARGLMVKGLNAALLMSPQELRWSVGDLSLCALSETLETLDQPVWKPRLTLRKPRPKMSLFRRLLARGTHIFRYTYWVGSIKEDFRAAPLNWRLNGTGYPSGAWPAGSANTATDHDSTALVRWYTPPGDGGSLWVDPQELKTHKRVGQLLLWQKKVENAAYVPFLAHIPRHCVSNPVTAVGTALILPLSGAFANGVAFVVRHGVCVDRQVVDLGCAGALVLIAGNNLSYDLSGRLVRDQKWQSKLEEIRLQVKEAASLALQHLGGIIPFLKTQPTRRPVARTTAGYQTWQRMIHTSLTKVVKD